MGAFGSLGLDSVGLAAGFSAGLAAGFSAGLAASFLPSPFPSALPLAASFGAPSLGVVSFGFSSAFGFPLASVFAGASVFGAASVFLAASGFLDYIYSIKRTIHYKNNFCKGKKRN